MCEFLSAGYARRAAESLFFYFFYFECGSHPTDTLYSADI